MRQDARFFEVARRHGIAERVLFRWKQEITPRGVPLFATVGITDANAPSDTAANRPTSKIIRDRSVPVYRPLKRAAWAASFRFVGLCPFHF